MRYGAAIPVLNEFRFLPAVVGQLRKVCDRVLVLRNRTSFSGAPVRLQPLIPLDPQVEIVQNDWPTEHDTRNAGMEILSDCDYIFTIDSDEIFTVDALELLKRECSKGHRAMACYLMTYWKTPRFRIEPPERICATVIAHRDVRFKYLRVIEGNQAVLNLPLMHHLSYVRTDEELKEKLRLFGHAKQISYNWYERVWKMWDQKPTLSDLHPTNAHAFARAVPAMSHELEAILQEYGVS